MESKVLSTHYAPAERASSEEIQKQSLFFSEPHNLEAFSDSLPNIFLALNKQRQIVFSN